MLCQLPWYGFDVPAQDKDLEAADPLGIHQRSGAYAPVTHPEALHGVLAPCRIPLGRPERVERRAQAQVEQHLALRAAGQHVEPEALGLLSDHAPVDRRRDIALTGLLEDVFGQVVSGERSDMRPAVVDEDRDAPREDTRKLPEERPDPDG